MMDFPHDADGDALRRVAEQSDVSKPMNIDFTVAVPSEAAGQEVVRLATLKGYTSALEYDDIDELWTCYCTKRMVPTYDGIIAAQHELDDLSNPFGGQSDGWGTSGNSK